MVCWATVCRRHDGHDGGHGPVWCPGREQPTRCFALGVALGLCIARGPALIWEAVVALGLNSGCLLSPPSAVATTLCTLWVKGGLPGHIGASLWRVFAGFGFGVLAGTALGALTGYARRVARLLDPAFQALRAIPFIAWVPLLILSLAYSRCRKSPLSRSGCFSLSIWV